MAVPIQFRLDIQTGVNSYFSSPTSPPLPASFKPILDICVGENWLNKVHGNSASELANILDNGLANLVDRNRYSELPDAVQSVRPQVEKYLRELRDLCRENDKCTVTLLP